MKILEIKCRFCGTKMGEYTLPKGTGSVTLADLDILDSRCDSCQALHGSFKEMNEIFYREVGADKAGFMKAMTDNEFKKSKFDAFIQKEKDKKVDKEKGGGKLNVV